MNDLHKSKTLVWSLFATFVIVTLYMLGVRTLVPPDEGRYAEMAREMFVTGDWVTTRLNGIKYFEKPPLQTWMNALSFAAFGLGEWQARLWTGVCGMLGVALTAHAGNKVFGGRVGLYAGLVLGSSLFWVASGQIDSLDMSLSGMMAVSLCALLIAQRDAAAPAERRNWMLVCWAGMALAVLAKGLIGLVLPGAVLVLYTLAARDWAIWSRLHLLKGCLLFFAIAAPWFVLVALRNPEQPHFFFIHEHFERFLLKTHHREGAWYYFFVMLIPGMMPWLALLPHSLAGALRRAPGTFQPKLMLLVWSVFIFAFFSYSSSKLPGYILPIFPALALLTACYLETASRRSRIVACALLAVVGAAGIAAVPYIVNISTRHPSEVTLLQAYQPWVLAAAFVALAGGALALLHARHLRRDMTVLTLACAGFAATQLILAGFEPYGRHRAGIAMLPQIQAELGPDTKIYSVGIYEQSLTFYLQRTVTLVNYWDEFSFGLKQQPELSIPTLDAFVAQWRRDAQAGVRDVAIIHENVYNELRQRGVPMRLVAQDGRRTVIANR
ncbi:glycosyltransferase family 39 protein [Janthinobacterium fluminis]|uniref:Glycosyltransferase family 39 protein n=1 Tax=Janthinobacterium fluminis TaxID=2987524 RepID=A0ABT5K2W9_9BURK|nr:glycosyltransferase family 39 protein [Janthinobacterium fluminis]MDC8759081.1 glycosyltransferase family 39 protein [Janthinobacterium fluminis]